MRFALALPLGCGLALLVSCGGDASPPASAGGGDGAYASAGAGAETAGNVDPASLLAEVQQGAPEDVVRLLLQWDTAGLRFENPYADLLARLYCYIPEEQCRSDEPVSEFAVVVDGYTLDPTFVADDTAQYAIAFDEVGALWPDRMADPIGMPPETLSLKRMDGRWRIVGQQSQMPEHLSRSGVLRRYRGVAPDSEVIARWLEEQDKKD